MASGNGVFLKVDCIEPVVKGGGICSRKTYLDGIKVWIGNDGHFFPCDRYTVCDPDAATEDGRRQVVELLNELTTMMMADNKKLFGYVTARDILAHFSYDEIVEKLEDWKKEKETIRVRDEVVNINNGCKMVITLPPQISSDSVKYMSGIAKGGRVYKNVEASLYKKTGLHVDDLDAYLEV